eukprot:s5075_g1.t2
MGVGVLAVALSLSVYPLVSAPALSEASQLRNRLGNGGFREFLHCRHSDIFREFFQLVSRKRFEEVEVFQFALDLHNKLDLSQPGSEDFRDELPWHTTIQDGRRISRGVDDWMTRQVMLLAHLFGVDPSISEASSFSDFLEQHGTAGAWQPLDCPYGFLLLEYAILTGFQLMGQDELRDQATSAIAASIEVLLHAPYYTYDFLESSLWNISLYDMAVNLDQPHHYTSFEDYVVSAAPPPASAALAVARGGPGDAADWRGPRLCSGAAAERPQELGLMGSFWDRHAPAPRWDWTALELWASAEAALKIIAGLQSTSWTAEEALDLELYFTRVKAIQGTDAGNWLAERVRVETRHCWAELDFATLKKMIAELKEGATSVEEVGEAWLPSVAPGLFDADLVLCSEPLHGRTMVGVLHMALLNEFPSADDANLRDMMEAQRIYLSISCRITAEQVAYQTGWRLPYVPFVGLGIRARYHPAEARRALLFRNNRQNMLTFRKALRMFLEEVATDSPVEVVDMNSGPRVYTFQEIAAFHAVIFLPHGPSALRLTDVYAAGIPSLVPEEPMSHKFIWSSRTFGGYDAERHCLSVAPPEFRRGGAEEPFAYHPTNYLQSWAIHRFIDDRRYWYRYTEWATLPHLLPFVSLPSLVASLGTLTRERGLAVSAMMAQHHALMVTDTLSWWRAALADALAQGEPWETRPLQLKVRITSATLLADMAPSAGGDRLSALSHCTRGGTISYGPARKPLPAKAPESVPASAFDTPLFAATQEPGLRGPSFRGDEGFDVVDEVPELPEAAATTRRPRGRCEQEASLDP